MRQPVFPLMLFAAGFGTRMGPLTAHRPKPLIPVAGRPLIDHALDLVQDAGCAPVVVNVHYLGDQIARHLDGRDIRISHEHGRILETGGGLRAALPVLGAGPVMTLNSDAIWSGANPLQVLARAWDPDRMDALLLLQDARRVLGRSGKADFRLDGAGRLSRAGDEAGFLYLGAQIIKTDLLSAVAEPVFSLNVIWDQMIVQGRACGVVYDGGWCDVGSPEGIAAAETMLGTGP